MKIQDSSSTAITTQSYWEGEWERQSVPPPIDPLNKEPENHFFQVMDRLFSNTLAPIENKPARLIEIGCGTSRWLPYFHRRFGFAVSGIDYTAAGVGGARAILDNAAIPGDIRQGDLFDPPPSWVGHFDVVVSFGLVEHFEDPVQVIAACRRYLRPGGRIFTLVPTMCGLYGLAYRIFRPHIYKLHVPHTTSSLASAHARAGLRITNSGYVLGLPGIISRPRKGKSFTRLVHELSSVYWRLERAGYGVPANRYTSPFCYCVANC